MSDTTQNPVDAFHAHLDRCRQCRNRPFDLCPEGQRLLHQTGDASDGNSAATAQVKVSQFVKETVAEGVEVGDLSGAMLMTVFTLCKKGGLDKTKTRQVVKAALNTVFGRGAR